MTTFYKITNKDIYEKLEQIEIRITQMEKKNAITKWIASSALALTTFMIGLLINGGLR